LEVWLGGRGPKALDRVGRIADGWLGAMLTPQEARVARERIQASADSAGREIDPEHFGLSIAYVRTPPEPGLLRALTARRADIDPLALLPVGEQGLRSFVEGYVDAGLSKFVIRPLSKRTVVGGRGRAARRRHPLSADLSPKATGEKPQRGSRHGYSIGNAKRTWLPARA
jgi:alkanesulfonate monooxygenase SsuD/methylene tetrahydromethanopterin reductase-like flavin-dependent oxidoreductase (luciferase family)